MSSPDKLPALIDQLIAATRYEERLEQAPPPNDRGEAEEEVEIPLELIATERELRPGEMDELSARPRKPVGASKSPR